MNQITSGVVLGLLAFAAAIANHYGYSALGVFFSDPATAASATSVLIGFSALVAGALKGYRQGAGGGVPKSAVALLLGAGLALALLTPGAAKAATRAPLPPHKPVAAAKLNITTTLLNLEAQALSDAITDITAGKALFDAQKDAVGSACYGEILSELTAIQQVQTAQAGGATTLPKVHLFYTFAVGRGFVNAFQINSPLNVNCAPLAQQTKMTVMQFVNGLVTGTLTATTFGPLIGLP